MKPTSPSFICIRSIFFFHRCFSMLLQWFVHLPHISLSSFPFPHSHPHTRTHTHSHTPPRLPPHLDRLVLRAGHHQAHGHIHRLQIHDCVGVVRGGRHRPPLLPHRQATGQGGLDGREGRVATQKEFASVCVLVRCVWNVGAVEGGGEVVRGGLAGEEARDGVALRRGEEIPAADVLVARTWVFVREWDRVGRGEGNVNKFAKNKRKTDAHRQITSLLSCFPSFLPAITGNEVRRRRVVGDPAHDGADRRFVGGCTPERELAEGLAVSVWFTYCVCVYRFQVRECIGWEWYTRSNSTPVSLPPSLPFNHLRVHALQHRVPMVRRQGHFLQGGQRGSQERTGIGVVLECERGE